MSKLKLYFNCPSFMRTHVIFVPNITIAISFLGNNIKYEGVIVVLYFPGATHVHLLGKLKINALSKYVACVI